MPKMDVGLSMLFCLGEPFSSLVKRLGKVSTRQVELVDEGLHALNRRRVNAIRRVAQSIGLELTLHAPWVDVNIASSSPFIRRASLKLLEKSISYAGQLGCRRLVFHPGLNTGISYFYPGLEWELNLESVRLLLKIAEKHDVGITIENVPEPYPFLMKSVQDFSRFYRELGEDVGLTLDVGHARLNNQIQEFISRFPDKIVHVHASDNDGTQDLHLGIGYGTIEWPAVAEALRKAGCSCTVMLESIEHVEESLQTLRKLFSD